MSSKYRNGEGDKVDMKVIFLSRRIAGRGARETVLRDVVMGLRQRGVVTSICLIGGTGDKHWNDGLPMDEIASISGGRYKQRLYYMFQLMRVLIKKNPDIIIGLDSTVVAYSRLITTFLWLKPKIGTWIHFSLDKASVRHLNLADFHLAISNGISDQLLEHKAGTSENIHVVYNPVDRTSDVIAPERDQCTEFVYVGRLQFTWQQRVSDLLYACSQLVGNWQLTIIGDSKAGEDHSERLLKLAQELGINDKIRWLGWKYKPWSHVRAASVLVLTSDYEGFPMVLLEAMARGLPCVSSNCQTGPGEIIKPGINGWLYPPRDVIELASILQRIVSHDVDVPKPEDVKVSISPCYSANYFDNLMKILENESKDRKPFRRNRTFHSRAKGERSV